LNRLVRPLPSSPPLSLFEEMEAPAPITSIETLPTELLEWLGEKKIKPGTGDAWVRFSSRRFCRF
jgi:hypothetical protein